METKKWKSEKQILNELKEENSQLKKQTTSQQRTIERLRRVLSRNVSILKKAIQRLDEDESVLGKHKNEGILTLGEDMIEEAEQLLNTTEPKIDMENLGLPHKAPSVCKECGGYTYKAPLHTKAHPCNCKKENKLTTEPIDQ